MPLLFDGIDDRINAANTGIPVAYPITAMALVRPGSVSVYQSIFQVDRARSGNGEWHLEITDTGKVEWGANNSGTLSVTGSISANQWQLIGVANASATARRFFSWNYETLTLAINESDTTSRPISGSLADDVKIGTFELADGVYADFFTGHINWIAIWNVNLDLDGMMAVQYLGPLAVRRPTHFWPFWENTGTTVQDIINGNTGTMTNFPASPWEATSLPGPWWARSPHRVIRRQAAVPPPAGLPTGQMMRTGVGR